MPPLLVSTSQSGTTIDEVVDVAAGMLEADDLVPAPETEKGAGNLGKALRDFEQRKFDLALHLAERYFGLLSHWQWGDSILEWIRQCEITFDSSEFLRPLLHPDVWPHAGRSSFVTLLVDKHVAASGITLEQAVGLRLTFRQPPPINCFSNQFLFYLNSSVADTAYHTWANLSQEAPSLLPPNRFHFEVHNLAN
ncbi:MAG: hypothetical protein ACRD8O_04315 [Bryobacteraceae bacterium]